MVRSFASRWDGGKGDSTEAAPEGEAVHHGGPIESLKGREVF